MDAGEQYYLENQDELKNLNLIDAPPANYPDYIKRPTLGCRALVRRSLQVLNSVLHEMEDWKEEVRLQSTKLLMQIVIHSEDHLATKYFDINAVLCKTCHDQEATVAKHALEVAKLVGHFVDQTTWSKYAFDELKIRQNKLGTLTCMNALYQHSSDPKRFENLLELSELLLDSAICHISTDELMKLLKTLIDGIPRDDERIFQNFYIVALKSTAAAYDNEESRAAGAGVLDQLAGRSESFENLSAMHEKFLKPALDTLDLLESFEQATILYGIICLCGFQVSSRHTCQEQHFKAS